MRLLIPSIVALWVSTAAPARAQVPQPVPTPAPIGLDQPLPVDPAVRIGTLPNGMTYYIRRNDRPHKRVSLRLAVKAGSVLEADDQQGLAHFLEHMSFQGSGHFKPGELVSYLESIGARFGADTNAFTTFDATVYRLDVPSEPQGLIEKGLLALGDFAARATLGEAEIDKERGVVLEEWRLGQGAASRMRRKQLPVILHGSRYAARLPIGQPEILRGFPPARLRDFARDFYRPDRMAIVVVGDVQPQPIEALLRSSLEDVPASSTRTPLPEYDVPVHPETLVTIATDPEASQSVVSVMYKRQQGRERTAGDYRREELLTRLCQTMVNDRLGELARRPDAPFLGAASSVSDLARSVSAYTVSARVADGGIVPGLTALLVEAERVRRHGFAPAELERARKRLLSFYETAWRDRDKSESPDLAGEYVSNFLEEEPIPGIEFEYRLAQQLLPGIGLEEMRELGGALIHDDGRVVVASAPEKPGLTSPTEQALREVVDAVSRVAVTPWVDTLAATELLPQKPRPARVASTKTLAALGVTVLSLANGVEVWLKPTDFKNDQIYFTAYSLGGTSQADPADAFDARLATSFVAESGLGGFTPVDLQKLLAGKVASVQPWIGTFTHGVTGSSTPADMETALQWLYLAFTRPNDRPEAFEIVRKRLASQVADRLNAPGAVYGDKVAELNTSGHYLFRSLRPEDVRTLRPPKALEFYRRCFRNAADFTFFFAGAFDVDRIRPLLETYLGGLPSGGRRSAHFTERSLRFPAGVEKAEVRKGREPRSATTLTFFADAGLDEREWHRARTAASILQTRLREILREQMSATYGVPVGYGNTAPQPGYGTMSISFGSSPENAPRLVAAVLGEVTRLQSDGPAVEDLQKVQEIQRRELEVSERENSYWVDSLMALHELGQDPQSILRRQERIDGLTPDGLRDAFRRYFPSERYTLVTLLPEAADQPAP